MNKLVKRWLIAALILIIIGGGLMGGVMIMGGWNFTKWGPAMTEVTHTLPETIFNVDIDTSTADVTFVATTETYGKVVCREKEKEQHTVTVQNGTLTIQLNDQRKWHQRFFDFGKTSITVYLPEGGYAALSIKESTGTVSLPSAFRFDSVDITASTGSVTCDAAVSGEVNIALSTGNIRFGGETAGSLALKTSTGRISVENTTCTGSVTANVSTGKTVLNNVTCTSLSSTGSTGDIALTDVIVENALSIERSTGDVKFEHSDAAELDIKTDTGDVSGSLRSSKVFITHTDTGRISVPESTSGGKCKVTTDTGDIKLTVN